MGDKIYGVCNVLREYIMHIRLSQRMWLWRAVIKLVKKIIS